MEAIDPSAIDQTSLIGQITMLLLAVGVILSALRAYLPKNRGAEGKSRVEILKDKVKSSEEDSAFTRRVNNNLSEWQLTAREVMRVLKNHLVDNGIEIPERVKAMEDHLRAIDEREIFDEPEP